MDLSEKRRKLLSILGKNNEKFIDPSPVLTETKMDQVSRSNIV
jgi:hypothetical protein